MSALHVRRALAGLAALSLAASLDAQVTQVAVAIGGQDAVGCQGDDNPPSLTGGVPASGIVDFTYDQSTQRLTLIVTNTSEVIDHQATPLLTRVYLNTPPGAIDSLTLVGQTAGDGSTPSFQLLRGDRRAGCLGRFEVEIVGTRGGNYGIANPMGNTGPSHRAVQGPVTFEIDCAGPGAANANARAFAYGFSVNGPRAGVSVGAKFQAGGRGAEESGFLSSSQRPEDCATSMWLTGNPVVGGQVQFCRNGQRSCHDCLSISLHPGPTRVGDYLIPIGFPLLAVIDGGFFDTDERCIAYDIPNDPVLSGVRLYFVIATYYDDGNNQALGIPTVSFGDQFSFQIQ